MPGAGGYGRLSDRHYPKDVVLWAVFWYCCFGVSYRDLDEMLNERGMPAMLSLLSRHLPR